MPETRSGKIGPDHQLTYRKKSPLKLIIGIIAVVLIAILVGWLLTHSSKQAAGGPGGGRGGFAGRRAAITVGTAQASLGAIPIQLDALGTVTPPVTATITSRIAGNLMAVYFTEGQSVKKGQKLALIDPRPYQVALEQAQGTMARDQAALANARLDLKRYTTLLAQNSIASQQVDTQAALVKQDEGVVKTDQAGVDNAKLNLAYTSITAPVAGRVGLRQVDVGNYVTAGNATGLVVITQVDPIDVVFTVPEDNVPQIVQRQRAGANLPVTVFNRSGGTALGQGQLATLDNQIDTATGTVKAKARFDNASGMLFPNQFVNARMLVDVLCNVVVVPATAVRHGSGGVDYVFTLQPDRTAKMVPVTTGPGTGETVSIAKGLMGNETVITEGGDRLRDGSQVTLPGDKPQGGSGFSGGRRKRPGAQQAGAAGKQGGQSGQGQRRRGGQGRPAGAAAPAANAGVTASETTPTQAEGLPIAQIPAGACPAPGQKAAQGAAPGGRRSGGQGGQNPAAGVGGLRNRQGPRGDGQDQGQRAAGQGRGQGGQGAFRRRGAQGQGAGPGAGQPQGQGQPG